jgi:hypothetical protein
MALNIYTDASFENMKDWKRTREKAEEVIRKKSYMKNNKSSRWIINGYYTNIAAQNLVIKFVTSSS